MIESGRLREPLPAERRVQTLERLVQVDAFERFLRRTYLGQKTFSIEGVDALVPITDEVIELAGAEGAKDVVMGMAHRGRLAFISHVVGRPEESILAEFEGHMAFETGDEDMRETAGDVKYHLGAEGVYETRDGRQVRVKLAANPSHLEQVNAVAEGLTRALQTTRTTPEARHDPAAAVAVLIHGDAAFTGQGVVAETLNLQALRGYSTGGTVHVIANNQIGFTTDPNDARSTYHVSDLARGFDIPVIHVNARRHRRLRERRPARGGLPQPLPARRAHQPDRLPPPGPQRARRAGLHAAGDEPHHQGPPAGQQDLRPEAGGRGRRHAGAGGRDDRRGRAADARRARGRDQPRRSSARTSTSPSRAQRLADPRARPSPPTS